MDGQPQEPPPAYKEMAADNHTYPKMPQAPPQEGYLAPPQAGYPAPPQGGYQVPGQVGYQAPPQGGYPAPPQGGYPPPPPQQIITTTTTTNRMDHSFRQAIPELPMGLAIVLCVINFILPGIGTVLAGFSVLCCGNVGQDTGSRFGTFCINFWVGWLQLVLVIFFVGWIWSIMWGVAFIAIAGEAGKQQTTTIVTTTSQLPAQAVPH